MPCETSPFEAGFPTKFCGLAHSLTLMCMTNKQCTHVALLQEASISYAALHCPAYIGPLSGARHGYDGSGRFGIRHNASVCIP